MTKSFGPSDVVFKPVKAHTDTPLTIMHDLLDSFYEMEARLEQVFGYAPIDVRQDPYTTELPFFDSQTQDEFYERFQKSYNDISSLMQDIKREEL